MTRPSPTTADVPAPVRAERPGAVVTLDDEGRRGVPGSALRSRRRTGESFRRNRHVWGLHAPP